MTLLSQIVDFFIFRDSGLGFMSGTSDISEISEISLVPDIKPQSRISENEKIENLIQ